MTVDGVRAETVDESRPPDAAGQPVGLGLGYVPACGDTAPHDFHHHTTMDLHFKETTVWCAGVCGWCPGRALHGPGEHK